MGKTSKPLKIMVDLELYGENQEVFEALEAQGHQIVSSSLDAYDVILAPNAWRTHDTEMLDITLKAARKVRYGNTK